MGTRFRGLKTGFNKTGNNDAVPNAMGPPATKFAGRGGVPEGQLKHYPGAVADTSMGNRRLAKSNHGDGGGSGTRYSGNTAFHKGR
jgi:hypothetical protein